MRPSTEKGWGEREIGRLGDFEDYGHKTRLRAEALQRAGTDTPACRNVGIFGAF
jgi:hypothetical protein